MAPIIAPICIQLIIFPMVQVLENPYYYAAAGGVLLGLATSLNYVLRGKVTGMSGIVYGMVSCHKEDLPEKLSIIGGMLLASGIFFDCFKYDSIDRLSPFGPADKIIQGTSYIGFALAGLLVGFGTKLGNGCTSGHGLCGLPRLSKRSFVAVGVFLLTAIAISTVRAHVGLGPFSDPSLSPVIDYDHMFSANVCICVGVLLPLIGGYLKTKSDTHKMTGSAIAGDQAITFSVGIIFGVGLLVSGMVRRSNILDFLGLNAEWNPSLLFVLGCGVMVNLFTFQYMLRYRKSSILGHDLFNPNNTKIDWRLITGATCFGLGWGIGGLCPGPAIMHFSIFTIPIHLIWFGTLIIGMHIARMVEHHLTELEKKEKQAEREKEKEAHLHPHPHQHHHHTSKGTHDPHGRPHILPPIQRPNEANEIILKTEIIRPIFSDQPIQLEQPSSIENVMPLRS